MRKVLPNEPSFYDELKKYYKDKLKTKENKNGEARPEEEGARGGSGE